MSRPWIGIDLDGTLAELDYSTEWDGVSIGDPIEDNVKYVVNLLSKGVLVKILTARASKNSLGYRGHKDLDTQVKAIEAWCLEHIGQALPVTAEKDIYMAALIDDRAVGVNRNTGTPRSKMESFGFLMDAEGACIDASGY